MVLRWSSAPAPTAARSPVAHSLSHATQSAHASRVQAISRMSRISAPSVCPMFSRHKCIIFEDDADREMPLHLPRKNAKDASVQIFVWCLMDNHHHVLAHGDMKDISSMMLKCNSRYARYFNARHGRVGHLFQERFGSEPVETEEYLLTVMRYIHQNPVKARLSTSCDYPWSSYIALRDDS